MPVLTSRSPNTPVARAASHGALKLQRQPPPTPASPALPTLSATVRLAKLRATLDKQPATYYAVRVSHSSFHHPWKLQPKRFSDFERLHAALSAAHVDNLPSLPPKHIFELRPQQRALAIRMRTQALQAYCNALLRNPAALLDDALFAFFNLDSGLWQATRDVDSPLSPLSPAVLFSPPRPAAIPAPAVATTHEGSPLAAAAKLKSAPARGLPSPLGSPRGRHVRAPPTLAPPQASAAPPTDENRAVALSPRTPVWLGAPPTQLPGEAPPRNDEGFAAYEEMPSVILRHMQASPPQSPKEMVAQMAEALRVSVDAPSAPPPPAAAAVAPRGRLLGAVSLASTLVVALLALAAGPQASQLQAVGRLGVAALGERMREPVASAVGVTCGGTFDEAVASAGTLGRIVDEAVGSGRRALLAETRARFPRAAEMMEQARKELLGVDAAGTKAARPKKRNPFKKLGRHVKSAVMRRRRNKKAAKKL